MKIALLNDTHWSARGDSQIFIDYFMKFFDDIFFPYLEENDITTIIHAGDFMDRRKFVNFNSLHQVRTRFIDKLHMKNITMHCIIGNHDVYYRNTNRVNSLQELFSNDMTIYDEPQVVNFDGLDIALLPWVNKENSMDITLCVGLSIMVEWTRGCLKDTNKFYRDISIVVRKRITFTILEPNFKSRSLI